ncbi:MULTISPECIES: hypothetical protein [unclassified Sulfitobacter]|uniref:hypothetical protein n=1 Tax=unclassified Sulfitobacter TaxID=196795 RepID=UPI0023E27F43|nr:MULTISPECIES: hypothetical protein [unclassified Sulfitobacter]MDF3416055.1 hypothetical protein [Sulfitobacter sp. KE5]MDF3434664.1 hypothetical protein [Sulfitobacter sp. KE42]MDF3491284.1 hypothetical protein [Sulfitobacter sp. M60]MDF3499091.1 hypothetical protein [Sulfitobacter sp. M56]MDF3502997.1 hypothetical protein [Sulfitobacter sp. Ks17]MDF3522488.1 hypothetical protein [Sulfitobacter sp. M74]MDF3538108.1 hypothetical protein [Sulfitobacter sp. M71]MDF3542074.1 hypothetical pr
MPFAVIRENAALAKEIFSKIAKLPKTDFQPPIQHAIAPIPEYPFLLHRRKARGGSGLR